MFGKFFSRLIIVKDFFGHASFCRIFFLHLFLICPSLLTIEYVKDLKSWVTEENKSHRHIFVL